MQLSGRLIRVLGRAFGAVLVAAQVRDGEVGSCEEGEEGYDGEDEDRDERD